MKQVKGVRGLAVVACALALAGAGCTDPHSASFLSKVATEMNKQLPKTLDDETEWTSVGSQEGQLIYNYKLTKRTANEVNGPALMNGIKPQAVQGVCANSDLKNKFLKNKVTLVYNYVDSAGTAVGGFQIAPSDCGL